MSTILPIAQSCAPCLSVDHSNNDSTIESVAHATRGRDLSSIQRQFWSDAARKVGQAYRRCTPNVSLDVRRSRGSIPLAHGKKHRMLEQSPDGR